MKKRYIDFVPSKDNSVAKNSEIAKPKPRKLKITEPKSTAKVADAPASKPVSKPAPKPAPKKITRRVAPVNPLMDEEEVIVEEIFAEREEPAGVSKGRKGSKYGVVEDYQPKFVKTEVKKRPLGAKNTGVSGTKTAKSAKKPVAKASVAAGAKTGVAGARVSTGKTMTARPMTARPMTGSSVTKTNSPMVRRTAFLNTNKIEKRPLSPKSAFVKRPVILPKEEPSKPVKIIEKPEKDSKAGLIIAIILTIILGAAAGTVAFLLLPK